MKAPKFVFLIIFLSLFSPLIQADNIIISQLDTTQLLSNQIIRLYLSVTDKHGKPLEGLQKDQFKLFESVVNGQEQERQIIDFIAGANLNSGINILLLLDNSGSMYDNLAGRQTANPNLWRITYAKQAITELLTKIKNPLDRIGLISFNIRTDKIIDLTDDKAQISKALVDLQKPGPNEGYTELYEALYFAIEKMKHLGGRKVIILLSDGENFPYKGENHPQFKERKGLAAALELALREGISVFTIGFLEGANNKDLIKIANETGGLSYQATKPEQLVNLYNQIRERVLAEYLITYYASMEPAELKNVTVKFNSPDRALKTARKYYSATVFGLPQKPFLIYLFLTLFLGLFILFVLAKTGLKSQNTSAALEILSIDGKKSKGSPVTLLQDKNAITISGSPQADLTITGEPKLLKNEITIKKTGSEYTIVSEGDDLKVNNQPVKSKKLRSGDLISVGGTQIVFNGGFSKKQLKALNGFAKPRLKNLQKIPRRTGKTHS